jgi:hypothetical protein
MHAVAAVRKPVALMLILALLTVFSGLGPAYASMIGTSEVLEKECRSLDKQRLVNALQRQEVRDRLESWGVDPEVAEARIQAMTERELASAAQNMEHMPAGGDGLGTLVGAAVFIFLVLLITDIAGLTDVFSFVKK